jgi:hypothetical protein
MPKLIDLTLVRTREGQAIAGDRKQVATAVTAAVRKGRKPRRPH